MKIIFLTSGLAAIFAGFGLDSIMAQSSVLKNKLYPASVRAFTLPNIGLVDAAHPTSRGEWKIEFGESLPKAVYAGAPGDSSQLEIEDLVCTSHDKGAKPCDIVIPADGRTCMLFVGKGLADTFTFVCPSKIDLVK